MRKNNTPDKELLVMASDLASWAYCPESWRLSRVQGNKATNQEQLRAGERHHSRWHAIYSFSRLLIWLGLVCLLAGLYKLLAGDAP